MEEQQIGWIAAIIIGGIAGWLAEQFMKSQMGLLLNIVLGIVGELTGMSARKAAEELNRRGIEAPAGGKWFATQVIGIRAVALPRAAAGLSASTDREVASCEAYEARFTGVIR